MNAFLLASTAGGAPLRRGSRSVPRYQYPRHLSLLFLTLPGILGGPWIVGSASAATWSVQEVRKEPPADIGTAFRELLQPTAFQVSREGELAYEFVLVKKAPLKSKPESESKGLDAVSQTTPLGAVVVPAELRDYRDKELFADTYTLRMGFQPQDGDHLGTSDFVYFLVLIPAKSDPTPEGISEYKPMVKASGKDTPSGHPVILSLRPVSSADGETPRIVQPAPDHTALRVKLPATVSGADGEVFLVFDIVCEGHSIH
jgi:hypothetical protein